MELEYLINERLLTSENDLKMEFRTHTFRASEFLYLVKNQTESYSSIKKKVDKDTTNRVDKTVDQEDFTSIYVQAHHGIVPKVESYTWVPCKTANIIIYISEHGDAWIHIRRY